MSRKPVPLAKSTAPPVPGISENGCPVVALVCTGWGRGELRAGVDPAADRVWRDRQVRRQAVIEYGGVVAGNARHTGHVHQQVARRIEHAERERAHQADDLPGDRVIRGRLGRRVGRREENDLRPGMEELVGRSVAAVTVDADRGGLVGESRRAHFVAADEPLDERLSGQFGGGWLRYRVRPRWEDLIAYLDGKRRGHRLVERRWQGPQSRPGWPAARLWHPAPVRRHERRQSRRQVALFQHFQARAAGSPRVASVPLEKSHEPNHSFFSGLRAGCRSPTAVFRSSIARRCRTRPSR